ncbi:DNA invertase Pin-like site-specific DNA recombinase [Streptosporangium becharense]|uniref:DNA invertase Pin-like site-specific DNA recombinase n=1 Tax=Streptosporangium becharense TaxID=1816182 RepID=A0A7W9IK76_9ACTN|nr:recombinase family protein [Streptosporangium becharense]MBB2913153.1 DNA invertase Pin-like site-specific DNA recombinase [Streptosporangium becharense]MBB5822136.1 DNA invertase Pin-like site-specific DNA recombinase [Streptosporangium becharense]
MKLTVDYARISQDRTGAALGADSQHSENEEFGEEIGFPVQASYTDNDRSAKARPDGTFADRPDYDRMIDDIRAGIIAVIIIWHANRLHRNVEEANRFIKVALEYGVRLFSVKRGGEYRLTRASGRADLLRDTVTAQEESEHRGERVALARRRQARTGTYGGGVRPYGWGVDTGRTRRVCINPKESPELREYRDVPVLDMGQHNQEEAEEIRRWKRDILAGVSMNQVLADLADRKVLTVAQKDGRIVRRGGEQVKHGGWNSKTVQQILTHPRTAGHSVYRGEIVARNVYPPIITEDERQALITLFADPTRKTSPGNTPKWLGSLIYECGFCKQAGDRNQDGSPVTAIVRRNSQGLLTYQCRDNGHCSTPAEAADEFVQQVMIARLSREDIADLLPQHASVDVTALREELTLLDAQEKEIGLSLARKTLSLTVAEVAQAEIDKRRREINTQITAASSEHPLQEFVISDDAARTWNQLTRGRKREIIRMLVTITLWPVGRGKRAPIHQRVTIVPNL